MRPKDLKLLKAAGTGCGAVVFLAASIVVTGQARHCQITGQPMPNGKGGFMTPGDGYLIALALFLISVAWFFSAWRFWHSTPV